VPAISAIDDSEASFLEAMRENGDDLTLTISHQNGHWIVAMVLPGADEPDMGEGQTFSEAWSDMKPHWHDYPATWGGALRG
jgi:hypothetical protein